MVITCIVELSLIDFAIADEKRASSCSLEIVLCLIVGYWTMK